MQCSTHTLIVLRRVRSGCHTHCHAARALIGGGGVAEVPGTPQQSRAIMLVHSNVHPPDEMVFTTAIFTVTTV